MFQFDHLQLLFMRKGLHEVWQELLTENYCAGIQNTKKADLLLWNCEDYNFEYLEILREKLVPNYESK